MNDIHTLLTQSGSAMPRRRLRADFTRTVTDYLTAHPRRQWQIRYITAKKWLARPVFAMLVLIFMIIAGGSTYAAVSGWPGIMVLFGGQQKLPDGSRIVTVHTKNCTFINAFTVTTASSARDEWYYRVKPGSQLTDEQIVRIVQGNCFAEEQAKFDQQVVGAALNNNPLNRDRIVGGYIDSTVTAVSDTSISLTSHVPMGDTLQTVRQTFNHIAPDVVVYESANRLSLRDIKVGDHVSIKYRASGATLAHSETLPPDKINPDEQVVVMINKNNPALTAAIDYQKYNGREFEQVVPCTTQADGYCNFEQYGG